MSDESNEQAEEKQTVTAAERKKIYLWAVLLVVLFATVGILAVWSMQKNKVGSIKRHDDRMNPDVGEGGRQPPPSALPAGAAPLRVTAGIYLDRIVELSVKEVGWTVDFYVWFRWRGQEPDPGEKFQIVDGAIESKEKVTDSTNGDERYTLYRVQARITKFFDVSRFPRDDHVLTINIETPALERHQLLFVADNESSGVSSRVQIEGYSIYKQAILEKAHAYRSTHGDPRLVVGTDRVHSELRMGVWVYREGWGFFLKLFIGLFGAVGVAMLAFFIKPTDVDPRFGLGVGALFAAIANTYITSSLVPDTGVMTLADIINGVGILIIFLSLLESTISLYLYDRVEKVELSRLFDRFSFVIFLAAYVLINVSLAWAASL
ncbi:MAG TPA: hypothetical protein VN256_11995 [Pyrinomonadaceae bacterium]|nr:hypothetical protein [Pyrinomonadaceae bacterium]